MEPPHKRSRSASVSFAEVLKNPECLLEWVDERSPTGFARFSKKKALFRCRVCKHDSMIAVGNVATNPGRKCGYCAHKIPPCSDLSCQHCQKDTVATAMASRSDVVWDESNEQSPNQVWRACNKKATWRCLTCDHTWLAAIISVTRIGSGCPFCSGLKLCGAASCDLCFPRSVACVAEDLYARNIVCADDNPKLVSKCSSKKVMWYCTTCRHTWSKTPNHIIGKGFGCPFCAGKRLCSSSECEPCFCRSVASSLAGLKDRDVEWHDAKDPRSMTKGCNKKATWSCLRCAHKWSAVISSVVTNGRGCPYCAGQRMCDTDTECNTCFLQSLASTELELRDRGIIWAPGTDARGIMKGSSSAKITWVCQVCHHDWVTKASSVTGGSGCPFCALQALCDDTGCATCFDRSVASIVDDLSTRGVEWVSPADPRSVAKGCNDRATWRCMSCHHEWSAIVSSVAVRGSGCPFCCVAPKALCSDTRCDHCLERSVASIVEELSSERRIAWADAIDPRSVAKGCSDKATWKCLTCHHQWRAAVNGVVFRGRSCPFCCFAPKSLCSDARCDHCLVRSVASIVDELAERNVLWVDDVDPRTIAKGSKVKAAWSCDKCKHKWSAVVYSVVSGSGCPKCVNKTQAMVHTFVHGFVARLLPSIDVIHEWSPDWLGRRRFDIGIPRLRLIVEVDGKQHYVQVANWPPPHETQANDRWKKERATENDFSVFRIRTHDIRKKGSKWKEHVQELIHRHALELEDGAI